MERDFEYGRPSEVLLSRLGRVLQLADPIPPGFGADAAATASAGVEQGRRRDGQASDTDAS